MTESPSLKYSSRGWEDKENRIYTEFNHISLDPAVFLKRLLDDDYFRGFPITAEEKESIYTWQKEHLTNQHPEISDIDFHYEFIQTSIGVIGWCFCPICMNKASEVATEIVNPNDFINKKEYKKQLDFKTQKMINKYNAKFLFQELS